MYPSSYQRFRDSERGGRGEDEVGDSYASFATSPRFADNAMDAEDGVLGNPADEALRGGHFSAYRLAQRQHVMSVMREEAAAKRRRAEAANEDASGSGEGAASLRHNV